MYGAGSAKTGKTLLIVSAINGDMLLMLHGELFTGLLDHGKSPIFSHLLRAEVGMGPGSVQVILHRLGKARGIPFIKIQSGCVLGELIYNNDRMKMLGFAEPI